MEIDSESTTQPITYSSVISLKYFKVVTGSISVLIHSSASARADHNVTGLLRISDTGIEVIIVYITESVTALHCYYIKIFHIPVKRTEQC